MKPLGFPKTRRLLTSDAFKGVFDHVDKKFFTKGFLVLVRKNVNLPPRLGLVVSKKNVSLSANRNIVKRAIRESFRINQQLLDGLDIVVLVRKDVSEIDRKSLWQALNQLWHSVGTARGKF
ncbi:MAG: ribonuclease P protein component [Gammaproteobacteria bacterium]|nr:ribonuclease P protein component [Gammaproteobacteria bacterium]